jgi:DNA invertase Pin-like site-specific DNA recombinase
MMGVFAEFERAIIAERVRAGLARARGRVNALGVPQSPPHSKNESVRLWRLLEGPVSGSSPNSSESTRARCSGSAALSSRTRSRPKAGQTVAAGGSIQNNSGPPQRRAGASGAL